MFELVFLKKLNIKLKIIMKKNILIGLFLIGIQSFVFASENKNNQKEVNRKELLFNKIRLYIDKVQTSSMYDYTKNKLVKYTNYTKDMFFSKHNVLLQDKLFAGSLLVGILVYKFFLNKKKPLEKINSKENSDQNSENRSEIA